MESLEIRVRKVHDEATIPRYANLGDAGMDLFSVEDFIINSRETYTAGTGISVELPLGYEAQIRPRSGLASKYGITILNAPGTLDSGYRGEIKVILINHGKDPYEVRKGDKIAQMVVSKHEIVKIVESIDITETERGSGGLGSTGR